MKRAMELQQLTKELYLTANRLLPGFLGVLDQQGEAPDDVVDAALNAVLDTCENNGLSAVQVLDCALKITAAVVLSVHMSAREIERQKEEQDVQ